MEENNHKINGSQSESLDSQIAVIIVPLPSQGHINQITHLSTILASRGLPVHYAGSATHNRQAKIRIHGHGSEIMSKIHFHDFELPPYSNPPPTPDQEMPVPMHVLSLLIATLELRQPVYELVRQLSTKHRRVVVIHDMFMASVTQDAKLIPNAETYALFGFSAFSLFISSWDLLDDKPFELEPGVIPSFKFADDVHPEFGGWANKQISLWGTESGRLYNTSRMIEGKYVELLERISPTLEIKHFAIGPFNPVEIESSTGENRPWCLQWLDKQEENSVMFVSFGTTVSQTDEQIKELAMGLERSGVKFIWVLRFADRGDIFVNDGVDVTPKLPKGFEERVQGRGIVVQDFAPQLEILAHPSTGGFMSHCGWNSCVESICMGVPIAAWPMHTDQPKNAPLVTEVLKIGTKVSEWTGRSELVRSNAVEKATKKLMASDEGEEMRRRVAELGKSVRKSVAKGGASSLEWDAFVAHICR